jgi:hypothetical protein
MQIIGIHLDTPYLKIALMRKKGEKVEIVSLKTTPFNETEHVKQLYTDSTKNFTEWAASCLTSKDFLIRSLELNVSHSRHLEQAIAFQAETATHLNPAEVLTVPLLSKQTAKQVEALLFISSRTALKQHLEQLSQYGIDPDSVSTTSQALAHFVQWKFPHLNEAFVLDVGSSETTCIFYSGGKGRKVHSIPLGVEHLLQALFEDRKKILLRKEIEGTARQIDLLLFKPGLNPHLYKTLNELKQEITKTQYSFGAEEKPILFTGRLDPFIHLREFLVDSYQDSLSPEEQRYAISIGLCLEALSKAPLQLRTAEFFPKKNWGKLGRFASLLMASSLALAALITGWGWQHIHSSKREMALKIGSKGPVEENIEQWIRIVEKNNKEYPYILQAPAAAEVLAWLSAHPLLNTLKEEGDPIDLRHLRYQLVSLPKIGSLKEPYLAKVELEFQFKSSMNARRFQEALRSGDDRINPEIKWEPLNEGYRAIFFLKNRGPHV